MPPPARLPTGDIIKIPIAIIAACAGTFAFAQATTMTLAEDGTAISDTRRIELI
jgi:hypothetical protein